MKLKKSLENGTVNGILLASGGALTGFILHSTINRFRKNRSHYPWVPALISGGTFWISFIVGSVVEDIVRKKLNLPENIDRTLFFSIGISTLLTPSIAKRITNSPIGYFQSALHALTPFIFLFSLSVLIALLILSVVPLYALANLLSKK